MTTLRVVIDGILDPTSRGVARYTEELARALILVAPRGTEVEGIVSASTEPEYADLHDRLPGLTRLYKTALSRRELVRAWQHGFTTSPGGGMIHAPSLLAPLRRHDRLLVQLVGHAQHPVGLHHDHVPDDEQPEPE